ncbi:hypothetical protein DY000_02007955 [Brassica cretica]|nr:hypothetical protein DY000_02007955 [Brassica cretica]
MPPVLGQSASCSRGYAHFPEEWSVCFARESCRGDEWNVDRRCTPGVEQQ